MLNRSALGTKNLEGTFNQKYRFGSPALASVKSKARKGLISNRSESTTKVLSKYLYSEAKIQDQEIEKTREIEDYSESYLERVKGVESQKHDLGVRKNNTPSFSKETEEDMKDIKKMIESLKNEQVLLKNEINSQKNFISQIRDLKGLRRFGELFRPESRLNGLLRASPEFELNNTLGKVKILRERKDDYFLSKAFDESINLPVISGCKSDRQFRSSSSNKVKYSKDQPILKNFKFPKDVFIIKKQ